MKLKRKVFGAVGLLTALILFLGGCGVERDSEGSVVGINPEKIGSDRVQQQEEEKAVAWSIRHKSLDHVFEAATIQNDRIYGCYYEDQGIRVSICDIQTGEELANHAIGREAVIQSISVGVDEQILVCGKEKEEVVLWQITQDGEIREKTEFGIDNLGDIPQVKGFLADKNGFFYLWYEMDVPEAEAFGEGYSYDFYTRLDRIYVLDQEMNCVIFEQIADLYSEKLICLLFDEKGRAFMLARDGEGYYTRRVRTGDGKEFEKQRIEGVELYEMEAGDRCAMTTEGLLFVRDGAVHLFHLEQARDEKLLEIAGAGIFEEDIVYLGMNGENIEIIDNFKGSERTEYSLMTPGEDTERVTVTLGVMKMTPQMKNTVAFFNRNQTKIKVEPVIYVEGYDYDSGYEKLKLDLIQGKAPDLITTGGIDTDMLANAGAFANLYEFMEEDGDCGRDKFVESVLKAYEIKGKLYEASPDFSVYTMWGGKSVVQGRQGVGMDELMGILRDNAGDVNSINGFSADESVLKTFCALGMDEFVDWSAGTCDFTGPQFQKILEFAKEYTGKSYDSFFNAIRSGEILFILQPLSSVEDYSLWSGMYGEDIEFIGYPTVSGSGTVAYFGESLTINSRTKAPAECWEFMKYFLLNGYEKGMGFPLVRDQLEKMFADSMQEDTCQNIDGSVEKMVKKSYFEIDNENARIFIYKAEEKDVAAMRKMIDSISGKHAYHKEIMNIIEEEAEGYFQGQSTMDRVTGIIQNRVKLYLDENKQ